MARSSSRSGVAADSSGVFFSLLTGTDDPGVEGGEGVAVDACWTDEVGDGDLASAI
jgi:hypothetical protein